MRKHEALRAKWFPWRTQVSRVEAGYRAPKVTAPTLRPSARPSSSTAPHFQPDCWCHKLQNKASMGKDFLSPKVLDLSRVCVCVCLSEKGTGKEGFESSFLQWASEVAAAQGSGTESRWTIKRLCWMDLEVTILSQPRPVEEDQHMLSLTWEILKYKSTYLQNKNRLTDIENKLMVTKGKRQGGG